MGNQVRRKSLTSSELFGRNKQTKIFLPRKEYYGIEVNVYQFKTLQITLSQAKYWTKNARSHEAKHYIPPWSM